MRCGCQCWSSSPRYCAFDSMYDIAPISGGPNSWFAIDCLMRASIASFVSPASASSVNRICIGSTERTAAALRHIGPRFFGAVAREHQDRRRARDCRRCGAAREADLGIAVGDQVFVERRPLVVRALGVRRAGAERREDDEGPRDSQIDGHDISLYIPRGMLSSE